MDTLNDLLKYVPEHSRICIVFEDDKGRQTTLYSGYKGNFMKYCEHQCIYPDDYKLTDVHGSSWDCKIGLIIGVKYKD